MYINTINDTQHFFHLVGDNNLAVFEWLKNYKHGLLSFLLLLVSVRSLHWTLVHHPHPPIPLLPRPSIQNPSLLSTSSLHFFFRFLFTFILLKKTPLIQLFGSLCAVSCHSLLPSSPPSCPFCNFFSLILLPSSSESRSHLVCWNAFSSPRAGINHSPFHTWQTVMYASDVCMLLEVVLLMSSNGDRLMSRETCVCTQSLCVCVSMTGNRADRNWN